MFMGEGIVEASVDQLMELFRELQSTKIVDPIFIEAEDIEEFDQFNRILRFKYQMPAMVKNRDFLFHNHEAILTDRKVKTGIVVGISVEHDKCPADPKFIRGIIMASGWVFEELEDNPKHTRAYYIVQSDPKGWLPVLAVNVISADQCLNVYRLKEHFGKGSAEEEDEKAEKGKEKDEQKGENEEVAKEEVVEEVVEEEAVEEQEKKEETEKEKPKSKKKKNKSKKKK